MDCTTFRVSRLAPRKIAIPLALLTVSSTAFGDPDGLTELYGSAETISLATGYEQPLFEAPATATVIDRAEIERLGATTLSEVLEQLPGIKVSTQDGRGTQVSVRGMTSNNIVLINNLPSVTGQIHAFGALDNVLLNDVERIEVVRGPGSARYGADASSAVINIITRSGLHSTGLEARVHGGSLDTYEGSLLYRQFFGETHVGLALQGRSTDFNDEHVNADAQSGFDAMFRTNASNAPGQINAHRDVVDARLDVSHGPFRARANYLNQYNFGTGVGLSWALDPEGTYDTEYSTIDLTYQESITPTLDITAYVLGVNIDQAAEDLHLFPRGAFRGAFPDGVLLEVDASEQRLRGETTATFRGFANHTLHFGVGAFENEFEVDGDRRNWTVRNGLVIPTGTFGELAGINDTTFLNDATERAIYSYLQDTWAFRPNWDLTLGVRWDEYNQHGSTFNPRSALVWSVNPSLALKLMYGRAFEPPSLTLTQSNGVLIARGDPSLEPQVTDMVEFAATHRSFTRVITASAFYYEEDKLFRTVTSTQSPNGLQFVNSGKRKGWGFEIDSRWELPIGILGFNYGYQRPDGDNSGDDDQIGHAPRHDINGNFTYRISNDLRTTLAASHIADRQRRADDPRPELDDYTLVNFGVSYKTPFRGAEVSLWAKNLLDEDYTVPSSTLALPGDIPQPGRTIYAELRMEY